MVAVHGRILCANLDELLLRTIQSFCDVNIRYEESLQILGSIHIRADNEEITAFLVNEKKSKDYKNSDWSSTTLGNVNQTTLKQDNPSSPEDSSPQGLPLCRSILGRRAIRRGRGKNSRYCSTPGRSTSSPVIVSEKRQVLHDKFEPGSCSTPIVASFDSGCQSSEDCHGVSSTNNVLVNKQTTHDIDEVEKTKVETEVKTESDDNDDTVIVETVCNDATRSFDTDVIEDGERLANIYEIRLPSYQSATGINKVGLEVKQEGDHYDTLYSPITTIENKSPDLGVTDTPRARTVTFQVASSSLNRLPDTPRPIGRLQVCTICGRRFSSRAELKIHHSRVHRALPPQPSPSTSQEFQPPQLPQFNIPLNFSEVAGRVPPQHMGEVELVKTDENSYQCTLCYVVLKTLASYRSHMNSQHEHQQVYRCSFCSKEYFSRQSVHQHKRRCHLDKK